MNSIFIIAAKEFKDGVRNSWVLASTLLFASLSLILTLVGSAPVGNVDASSLAITVVSLSSLSIYLIPLIALLLAYDAIVGEVERGTLLLFLTYPVSRWAILTGKFLGHLSIMAFSITIGFAVAAVTTSILFDIAPMEDWLAFASLLLSSIMLGAIFIAIAYLISTIVKERSTAAGISVFVWIFFVLLFDMALIALVMQGKESFSEQMLTVFMMFNPTDIYRIINLTGFDNVRIFTGLASATDTLQFSFTQLFIILSTWIAAPFIVTGLIFKRKEV